MYDELDFKNSRLSFKEVATIAGVLAGLAMLGHLGGPLLLAVGVAGFVAGYLTQRFTQN